MCKQLIFPIRFTALFFIAILLSCLNSCSKEAPSTPDIPEVFVVSAEEQPYHLTRGFNGRVRSSNDVDIQAQVTGELIAIHFKEGDIVTVDDPLFDIDPAPFEAELSSAKGELARSQAAHKSAQRNYERGKTLIKDGFISEREFDELEARAFETQAAIDSANAAVDKAQVNLTFTSISSPQNGRIARSIPAVGDIVGPQSGALTSIVGEGGMDVVFQLPEKLLISLRHDNKVTPEDVDVAIRLPDGSRYNQSGKITYLANRIDPTTGTFEVMASFLNDEEILRPGMFVKVILQLHEPLNGLQVPQAAVQVDQQGTYVLTVNDQNLVVRQNLKVGDRIGENTLVNSGLDKGAQVIIRGIQKARTGQAVKPIPFQPATKTSGEHSDQ